MLKLEARPEASKLMSVMSPVLALAITVVIGTALFMMLGKDPMRGLYVFFVEPVKSRGTLVDFRNVIVCGKLKPAGSFQGP